ncbi:ABC transporter ATP-binding protein [Agromyces aerolatus]|uniref:ABC transporter ATP-binding protein n=1 Tax=Agromyces sp. LY-1074 TaxID=3074080 RepID=UPI002861EBF1|nr:MULTISPECIES: ABC transporter ATP-binding protein [unclassified Agromyces]MDR5700444.1 ABC transporter ATP-binding protein [Agromyces sp. LY-1074]MDR5706965.1 ABC transporter ATP-binding protein [Agromyces sp. LY-1358]
MAIVEVRGLRKTYGPTVAVDDLDLDVDDGEIFGILGPNGSGKTTTVECIAGLRRPDAGVVQVTGLDPHAERARVTRVVGVQLQQAGLPAKQTVREAVTLYASFYDDPVDGLELVERLGLGSKLDTRYADLSGGQQQRLAIALALVGRPRVALLDELSTGLDPRSRREVWRLVEEARDAGTTVILVTHFMEEARHLCDRVAVIDQGRLTALDTPEGVIGGIGAPTVMSFAIAAPVEVGILEDVPGVAGVRRRDDGRLELSLTDEAVLPVLQALAARGMHPERLRIVDATLDDAFLDLTGPDGED